MKAAPAKKPHQTEAFNLIEKYEGGEELALFEKFKSTVKGFSDTNEELGFKTGDTIQFIGGYNEDIHFISKILGFDDRGWAFVLWDCYWLAIDLNKRLIPST